MTTHLPRQVSLRAAVGIATGTAVVFFAGVYAAHAGPGVANVSPRTVFTISGRVTNVLPGTLPLTFTFHRGTGATALSCTPPIAAGTSENYEPTTNSYSIQLDYGADADAGAGVACPPGFFNGSDVTVDVFANAGSLRIVGGAPINPVPYAQFAANAGSAAGAVDGGAIAEELGRTIATNSTRRQVVYSAYINYSGGHFVPFPAPTVAAVQWLASPSGGGYSYSGGVVTLPFNPGSFGTDSSGDLPHCVGSSESNSTIISIAGVNENLVNVGIYDTARPGVAQAPFTIICMGLAGSSIP